jgi:hypothetical protein
VTATVIRLASEDSTHISRRHCLDYQYVLYVLVVQGKGSVDLTATHRFLKPPWLAGRGLPSKPLNAAM